MGLSKWDPKGLTKARIMKFINRYAADAGCAQYGNTEAAIGACVAKKIGMGYGTYKNRLKYGDWKLSEVQQLAQRMHWSDVDILAAVKVW